MLNPFNFGTPVSPDKMVGRWKQIKTITNDLVNPGGHSHIVIGGRRFGKSSFLEALQYNLIRQLDETKQENRYVFPVFINLKRLNVQSTDGVFGFILNTVYKYFFSPRVKKKLALKEDYNLEGKSLLSFVQSKRNACSLEEFSIVLDELLEEFGNTYGTLRFVFLLDEIEVVLDEDWTEALFSQLRSLIYEWLLRDSIHYVIAGSSRIVDVREKGSPLLNMLNISYLEALEDQDILEIVNWASDVPSDVAKAVLKQCGGHPFIAQYLMYRLWEMGASKMTSAAVTELTSMFIHEHYADLEQWLLDVGQAGQLAYQSLVGSNTWQTEAQVRKLVNKPELSISRGLITLCCHGLAIQQKWSKYLYTGELFRDWFTSSVQPALIDLEASTQRANNALNNNLKDDNQPKALKRAFQVQHSHAEEKPISLFSNEESNTQASVAIRWLHLSDFHVGKDNYGQYQLFKYILANIKAKIDSGLRPDIVFISGDIANKGQASEYRTFYDSFYLPLLTLLGDEARGRIFLVPGNHDVDRSQTKAVQRYGILSIIPEFLDPTDQGLAERTALFPRFQTYAQYELNQQTTMGTHWLFSPRGVYTTTIEIRGHSLGILCINTAWLSGSDSDQHQLSPGKGILEMELEELKGCDTRIVLGHHPIDWFLEDEISSIYSILGKSHIIYLHGHLHKTSGSIQTGAGHPFLTMQAGASFQAREDEIWVNRMLWCTLYPQNGYIQVEPLRWSKDYQEWSIDGTAFPELYRQLGADRWLLPLPHTHVPPSHHQI